MSGKTTDILLAYGTCPDMETARKLAKALLDARVVACVNLLPGMVSLYHWQGEMEEGAEILFIAKTQRSCFERAKDMFAQLHPYEEPAFVGLPVSDGLDGFLTWIAQETKGS